MEERQKVYTKTGDEGKTALLGGTRVKKYHDRIEAYGTMDELNAFIGLIRDSMNQAYEHERTVLLRIQEDIFIAESLVAQDPNTISIPLPSLTAEEPLLLEQEIDRMDDNLPQLQHFILPGGDIPVSYCHVARTVSRRAERRLIKLHDQHPIDEQVLKFFNRLSDYLFVLARKLLHDTSLEEVYWKPQHRSE